MRHCQWLFFGVLASIVILPAKGAPITKLNDLRVIKYNPTHYRFIVNVYQKTKVKTIILKNPNRLAIDIDNSPVVRFNLPGSEQDLVTGIRSGNRGFKNTRLVFDLKPHVTIGFLKLLKISDRHIQVIIDLRHEPKAHRDPIRGRSLLIPPLPTAHLPRQTPGLVKPKRAIATHRPIVIVIDPGHGGADPGAIGPRRIREKDLVLRISYFLGQNINKKHGFRAYLTREGDHYLSLRQRLAIARRYKADMFVAIHADAYKNHRARGASVFALSQRGATSEAARWLAKKENESELMGGVNLADKTELLKSVLINLSQTATIRSSLAIGQNILNYLNSVESLHHQHVEQAAFVVLKSPDIPSLLIETGYISNFQEEKKLLNTVYQKKVAAAIARGIVTYFKKFYPANIPPSSREGKGSNLR